MHRTTLAATKSIAAAVQLLHHRANVTAFGDTVPVAAMGTSDIILFAEIHADSHGRSFLACVKMDEAGDFSRGELNMDPLLKFADQAHVTVGVQKLLA